ncbi:MAG: DNA translocase FtsK 4TM domain-containing protein [Bacillota bacterium]
MSNLPVSEDNDEFDANIDKNRIENKKNEIAGILFIAWGILSVFALFTNKTGIIGIWISESFSFLVGKGAYLIPLIFILIGFSLIRFKRIIYNIKIIAFLATFIIILSIYHTYMYYELTLRRAFNGQGGGVIGGSVSWFFLKYFGIVGTYIILFAFLLITILLWSNIKLKSILHSIENFFIKIFVNLKEYLSKLFKYGNKKDDSKDNEVVNNVESEESSLNEEIDENINEEENEEYDFYDTSSEENNNEVIKENNAEENSNEKVEESDEDNNVYRLPPLKLLERSTKKKLKLSNKTELLENTLESFGVNAKVVDVNHGPTITRYEVQPASGVKVSKIVNLANDLALALAAPDVRIEAPIPGKAAVGIEVPHGGDIMVKLRDIIASNKFQKSESKLPMALGKSIDGDVIITDLSKMPHLLVAGATGSGKSVFLNTVITSFLYKATPDELKLILVDPKKVELSTYKGLPHLFTPVVTNPKKASNVLKLVVNEMEQRYELFSESGTKGIKSYNKKVNEDDKLPYIVVIIDELSDLMMAAANEVEDNICRLAQMSRAAGIHLIIATQRPSVDVITGLIKANIPSRISFAVSSQTDSRTILDVGGAEKLLGKGDMLFAPVDASKAKRIQGAFMSDEEINRIVNYAKNQSETEYEIETDDIQEVEISLDNEKDELYEEAVKLVVNYRASISMLQRRLHIGHSRAARMIDTMEEEGIVGPYAGSKPREVLIDENELEEYLNGNESENNGNDIETESEEENSNSKDLDKSDN